VKMKRLLLLIR